ncbi:hypothetical protein EYF80_014351 [Liparis tanakae]|uniref:Uncharacterized protein n=1 Tax=Liparis tanakae TaxID=230148 RepID=A0A4Z2IBW9_9TELE|nr:hypothetical protein EYF80_014351 [Liparis tanakae]
MLKVAESSPNLLEALQDAARSPVTVRLRLLWTSPSLSVSDVAARWTATLVFPETSSKVSVSVEVHSYTPPWSRVTLSSTSTLLDRGKFSCKRPT